MIFDAYKNERPHPDKRDFIDVFYYKGGKVVAQFKGSDPDRLSKRPEGAVKEEVVDKEAFKAAKRAHNERTAYLNEQFKLDLFKNLGIENHPMREKLYSKAWEDGHSAGLSEVYNCAQDLVELIEVPRGAVLVTKDAVLWGGLCPSADAYSAAANLQGELG